VTSTSTVTTTVTTTVIKTVTTCNVDGFKCNCYPGCAEPIVCCGCC
jgi:hypothetical protein